MEILQTLGTFALTGVVISTIAQYTKSWLDGRAQKMIWVIILSVIGGLIVWGIQFVPGAWWQVITGVWAAANTVYLFFFKEKSPQ